MKKRLDIKKVDTALRQAAHAGVYGRKDERAGRINCKSAMPKTRTEGKAGAVTVASKESDNRKLEIQK
jgi:hypothetical protein